MPVSRAVRFHGWRSGRHASRSHEQTPNGFFVVAVDSSVVNEGGQVHRVTQPVEAPQGWDMFAGGPAPAIGGNSYAAMSTSMPVAAARMPMAAPPPAPTGAVPPAAPRPYPRLQKTRERHEEMATPESFDIAKKAEPAPYPITVEELLRMAVQPTLDRFRASAGLPVAQRVALLVRLVDEIKQWLVSIGNLPESTRSTLRKLAQSLAQPPTDEGELGRTWRSVIETLESVLGQRRRPFWKRSGQ